MEAKLAKNGALPRSEREPAAAGGDRANHRQPAKLRLRVSVVRGADGSLSGDVEAEPAVPEIAGFT